MKQVKITYRELFDIIEKEENHKFIHDKEFFQRTKIKITDEYGEFKKVKGLIKKEDKIIRLIFSDNTVLSGSESHLILTSDGLKELKNLSIFDNIINKPNLMSIEKLDNRDVFDLEIDNESHLYSIADGSIHHNTLLTSAIIEYANRLNMKTITIVPSTSLLKQTHDYIQQFDIPVGKYGAGKKDLDEKNIVATWQSLQNNKSVMNNFECVIWDECHNAKAYVAQQIMQEAKNAYIKVGLTGTIPKDPLDKANLTAAFGPVIYEVLAKDLQKRNILSSIQISIMKLNYPKSILNSFIDWHDETSFLQSNEHFQKMMKALVEGLKGNTLILLKNIDPAEELAEFLGVDYISSKLSVNKRQEMFDNFKHGAGHIAIGTYSLLSTGIDIVFIDNLVLAPTPGKSFTKTIQSIGRGLRRKDGKKEHVNVFDITSNLKYDKKHIKERKDYYKDAGYPFDELEFDMEELFGKFN